MAKKKLTKEEDLTKEEKEDLDTLDRAATCVAANSPQSGCNNDIKAFLCRIFWCADANPIKRGNKKYKQSCADKLLTAYRAADDKSDPDGMGRIGRARFYNSMRYVMKPIEKGKEPDYSYLSEKEQEDMKNRKKDNPEDYSLMNIDGRNQKCKIRTPDVSIYDKYGNLIGIFDFKFEGDTWRDGQLEDYRRLVNDGRENAYKNFVEKETRKSNAGQNEDPNSLGEYEKTNLRQTPDNEQEKTWKERLKKDCEKITKSKEAVAELSNEGCKDHKINITDIEEQKQSIEESYKRQKLKADLMKNISDILNIKTSASNA